MNQTIEFINNRISLRKYADMPISEEHEGIILNSAMRAPTAGGMMLYSIIKIKNPEKARTLSVSCDNQPFIATSPLILVFVADYRKLYDFYRLSKVKEYCQEKNLVFEGPDRASLMLGISDAMVAAQNAVIAAESLGIGSCYIGDIMENCEQHRELLKLPEFVFPIGMLTLGYYPQDHRPAPRSRFKKEYVVFDEEYRLLEDSEITDLYSSWNASMGTSNPFGAQNAGQLNYARKTGADFSIEMDRSVREFMKQWDNSAL